jgi:hypothetical protein
LECYKGSHSDSATNQSNKQELSEALELAATAKIKPVYEVSFLLRIATIL